MEGLYHTLLVGQESQSYTPIPVGANEGLLGQFLRAGPVARQAHQVTADGLLVLAEQPIKDALGIVRVRETSNVLGQISVDGPDPFGFW
jgi:hypothetical protein